MRVAATSISEYGTKLRLKGVRPVAMAPVTRMKEVGPVRPQVADGGAGDFKNGRQLEFVRSNLCVNRRIQADQRRPLGTVLECRQISDNGFAGRQRIENRREISHEPIFWQLLVDIIGSDVEGHKVRAQMSYSRELVTNEVGRRGAGHAYVDDANWSRGQRLDLLCQQTNIAILRPRGAYCISHRITEGEINEVILLRRSRRSLFPIASIALH